MNRKRFMTDHQVFVLLLRAEFGPNLVKLITDFCLAQVVCLSHSPTMLIGVGQGLLLEVGLRSACYSSQRVVGFLD